MGFNHISKKIYDDSLLCYYGCGKSALFLTGQKNLRPCCSEYYSQCENIRNKNKEKNIGKKQPRGVDSKLYGRKREYHSLFMKNNNPMFIKEYKDKVISVTQSEEYKEKMSDTITNMFIENPEIKNIISNLAKERWRDKRYRERYKETLDKKGLRIPDKELSKKSLYYRNVDTYTKESLRSFYDKINPDNKPIGRGKGLYSIDHKCSKVYGFLNNIDAKIIGSWINLEVILFENNAKKKRKCSISKRELITLYKEFMNNENNF